MSKLQEDFCKLLLQKRIELKETKEVIQGVSITTIGRWQSGSSSPTLETVEQILLENDMELPFFFNGNIESLVDFNKKIAEKKGLKMNLIFEV